MYYKGFYIDNDGNMTSLDFHIGNLNKFNGMNYIYSENLEYKHYGIIEAYRLGFHYATSLNDLMNMYPPFYKRIIKYYEIDISNKNENKKKTYKSNETNYIINVTNNIKLNKPLNGIIKENQNVYSFKNGFLDSYNDEPAIIEKIKKIDNSIGIGYNKYWFKDGLLNRDEDEPAIIYSDDSRHWYKNGDRHRDYDLPAIKNYKYKEYYTNGRLKDYKYYGLNKYGAFS